MADPEYGRRVAEGLKLDLKEFKNVEKQMEKNKLASH